MSKSIVLQPGWLKVLGSTGIFKGLGAHDLAQLVAAGQVRRAEDDAFFFMEEEPAQRVFVLLEGKVKLSQVTASGQQVILEYIEPGREFGLVAVLGEGAYPVSAQAVGVSQALSWNAEEMNRQMEKNPLIMSNVLKIMARQIGYFQNRIRELATQRVEQRIARTLLRLAQRSGKRTAEGVLIDFPLSRQDLAEMTGTTLFTVSRTLKQWESQGLILSRREQVVIRFPHGLVSIAEDL